ncbi:TPA: hypothetical protein ACF3SN_006933, partial [Pseudomonas aeruginosa]
IEVRLVPERSGCVEFFSVAWFEEVYRSPIVAEFRQLALLEALDHMHRERIGANETHELFALRSLFHLGHQLLT